MMVKHCADARFVWNLGLEQRNLWRRGMKSISVYDQKRSLTGARNTTDWLGAGSSVVQQQALFDLDRAFRNWWKNPSHFRRPTWRKVGLNEGFYVRDLSVRRMNRHWSEVKIPKAGWVRLRVSRLASRERHCGHGLGEGDPRPGRTLARQLHCFPACLRARGDRSHRWPRNGHRPVGHHI